MAHHERASEPRMGDRWHRLKQVALEFEQQGRDEANKENAKRLEDMDTAFRGIMRKHMESEAEIKKLQTKLQQERTRTMAAERELIDLRRYLTALNLNQPGSRAALFTACDRGDVETVRSFLQPTFYGDMQEAETTVQSVHNESLRIAASVDRVECCAFLLRLGANPAEKDRLHGRNAFHCAVGAPSQSERLLKMLMAEKWTRSHIDDVDGSGATPLTLAVQLMHLEKISFLLSMGAKPQLVPEADWTRLNESKAKRTSETSPKSETGITGNLQSTFSEILRQRAASPARASVLPVVSDTTNSHPDIQASDVKEGMENGEGTINVHNAEQWSVEAEELYHAGRLSEAYDIYERLDKIIQDVWSRDNRAMLYYNAARTAYRLERKVDCVEWCDRLISIFPDSRDALSQRAEAYVALCEFNKAALDFEHVARLDVGHSSVWQGRAHRARTKHTRLEEDLYSVLGVGHSSSSAEIKRAYHTASRKWHPDKNQGSRDAVVRSTIMFKAVSHAYQILCDPLKRAQHDANRLATSTGGTKSQSTGSRTADFDDDDENSLEEFDEESENMYGDEETFPGWRTSHFKFEGVDEEEDDNSDDIIHGPKKGSYSRQYSEQFESNRAKSSSSPRNVSDSTSNAFQWSSTESAYRHWV